LSLYSLPTADVEIADFGEHRALVVTRFDRLWAQGGRLLRLPQEDMCQALSTPPAIKYESDGGPGIEKILRLLSVADDPAADQSAFLKANIWFWLLDATDGHAKNFSVFLRPGGRYRMTPLYDVLSAQPTLDAGQVRHNQFKLSMAVGDRRNYVMESIAPRHFIQTAGRASVGEQIVQTIFEDLQQGVPAALDAVEANLTPDFPADLFQSVTNGISRRLNRLGAG
jgi:serine/threonine-protein kinase HipA